MKRKYFISIFVFFTFNSKFFSQELIQVTDETLTVNSTSAISGYTRNKTEVILPEKTIGYIYRISIFPKGENPVDNSLFDLLQNIGSTKISLAGSFAEFAVRNNDNNAVDAFIFNNVYDADNFYSKKDQNWNACKSMPNRVNCCFATKECIGRQIYFGFRNNNIMQGLNIRIEIVALVDKTTTFDYKYSYTINNSSGKELKYSLSLDGINWQETQLRSGYLKTHTIDKNVMYFKIFTDDLKFVTYKLIPNERYKIFLNTQGLWDLIRY